MNAPIFAFDGRDLIVFDTREDVASFVEPYDVNAGHTYDSEGQVLLLEMDGRTVSLGETGRFERESLRAALYATLSFVNADVNPDADLARLKAVAEERFRYVEPRSPHHWLRGLFRRL